MTLTEEQIEAIKARADAATPGPWGAIKGSIPTDDMRCVVTAICGKTEYVVATIENGAPGDYCDTEWANALFMSHARTDIPALLAHIAEQDAALAAEKAKNTVRPDYPFYCDECGRAHILDTVLPNEIWNRIADPNELLCALCIDGRLKAADIKAEAKFYFVGEAMKSSLYAEHLESRIEAEKKRADEAEALVERLKREAVQHAQEARTANATIAEAYQAVTGGAGEPGNWHGAEPIVAEITRLREENERYREAARERRAVERAKEASAK